MATYKGIQGYSVQKLSSDPTVSEAVGQLWYNSGTGKFKVGTQDAGTWASGGTITNGRYDLAGCGLQSAGLIFGGAVPFKQFTEKYDGTTWTEVGNLTSAGRAGGLGTGTQDAAIAAGGSGGPGARLTVSETWDGTSWSEANDMLVARIGIMGTGITAAALGIMGNTNGPAPTYQKYVEEYDGTCWCEGNDTNTARGYVGASGKGTVTASLIFGGQTTVHLGLTEVYDGSSWSEVADLNQIRSRGGGSGTSTAALYFGGAAPPGYVGNTEIWDGTSWTATTNLTNARESLAGAGTSSLALAAAGAPAPGAQLTEEWTDPVYAIKTVTVS